MSKGAEIKLSHSLFGRLWQLFSQPHLLCHLQKHPSLSNLVSFTYCVSVHALHVPRTEMSIQASRPRIYSVDL